MPRTTEESAIVALQNVARVPGLAAESGQAEVGESRDALGWMRSQPAALSSIPIALLISEAAIVAAARPGSRKLDKPNKHMLEHAAVEPFAEGGHSDGAGSIRPLCRSRCWGLLGANSVSLGRPAGFGI